VSEIETWALYVQPEHAPLCSYHPDRNAQAVAYRYRRWPGRARGITRSYCEACLREAGHAELLEPLEEP